MIERAFNEFPVLETDRLLLRRIGADDAGALYGILSDEEVTRFYDDDAWISRDQALEQIESWNLAYSRRASIRWGICLKPCDALIGTCGYYGFHSLHMRASIGYELGRSHWRMGIMSEALGRMIRYGMDTLELRRIQAYVMPGNEGSTKVLMKLGFVAEGTLRDYETWGSKGFVDLISYSLLSREWPGP